MEQQEPWFSIADHKAIRGWLSIYTRSVPPLKDCLVKCILVQSILVQSTCCLPMLLHHVLHRLYTSFWCQLNWGMKLCAKFQTQNKFPKMLRPALGSRITSYVVQMEFCGIWRTFGFCFGSLVYMCIISMGVILRPTWGQLPVPVSQAFLIWTMPFIIPCHNNVDELLLLFLQWMTWWCCQKTWFHSAY